MSSDRKGSHRIVRPAGIRLRFGLRNATAPQPVAFYAAVFFLVNVTYIALIWELIERTPVKEVSPKERRIMRFRSITTLFVFGIAAVVALKYPLVGLGMCICCLIVYLKPRGARSGKVIAASPSR